MRLATEQRFYLWRRLEFPSRCHHWCCQAPRGVFSLPSNLCVGRVGGQRLAEDSPPGVGSAQGSDPGQLFPDVGQKLQRTGLGKAVTRPWGLRTSRSVLPSECSNLVTCNRAAAVTWHSWLLLIKMVEIRFNMDKTQDVNNIQAVLSGVNLMYNFFH